MMPNNRPYRISYTFSTIFLIGIVVSTVFLILVPIQPLQAAPVPTTTTILSDTGVVAATTPPQFTILVYTGVDPVPTGPVLLTHLNTSQTDTVNIVNGVTTTTWPWTLSTPGTHVFQASFQGFQGYQASSGSRNVIVEDITPGFQETTSLELAANSSVVHKGDTIQFILTLSISGGPNWYFEGGYLSVTNTNLSGSPTIHLHGPLPFYFPDTNPALYIYTFDYVIPDFSPTGVNDFIANYTGSAQSSTTPSVSPLLPIQVNSDGLSLIQQINTTTLQRAGGSLEINTTVVGDYPVGLPLETYYFDGGQRIRVNRTILTSRTLATIFTPNSSVSLGPMALHTILTDISGSIVYDNLTQNLILVDHVRIDPSTNASMYRHNETIEFSVYITEEDIWTHPVSADVELRDVTDGNRSLEIKSTDGNGFVLFTHKIPHNSTVGTHNYALRTFNTPSSIVDKTQILSLTIKGVTTIDLDYGTGVADRGTFTTITTTVLSGGVALSEGQITLEFANGTIIETKTVAPGLDFSYYIDPDHGLGVTPYQVHYLGSPNYDAHIETFDLTVFSTPVFNTTGQNASEVVKGETLRLWGELLDEIGNPVYFEQVGVTDTTTGVFLGTVQTNVDGIFVYDYFVSPNTQIGLHFVELTYAGNVTRFYRGAPTAPVLSFTVRPPLSVMIATEVVASNWSIISLGGGLNDWIDLSWQKAGEATWSMVGTIQLNGSGQGSFNWSTPYYKGDFTIRAQGPSDTRYDASTMWVLPDLSVEGTGVGNVNDPYQFTVNSSERYQIWIQGSLWQDWVPGGGGVTPYSYTFTSQGVKTLLVRTNDTYVYLRESWNSVSVYEAVTLSLTAPATAAINVTIHLDGLMLGEITGPLVGYDAVLLVNSTGLQVDATNGAGRFDFYIQFSQPGIYALQVKAPSTGYFQEGWSLVAYLDVKPEPPIVHILEPTATEGAIVPITLAGNAQTYWFYIESLDSTNITWTAPVYRSLQEGSYTLHAYGQNQWGLTTHISTDFMVDTTAPSLGIISPLNISYATTTVPFNFLTDAVQTSGWLDGTLLATPYPSAFQGLTEGSHLLRITAQDLAGNSVTQQVSFTVDTIPPTLTIETPYNQSYTGSFNVSLVSDAATLLYHIAGQQTTNQTYTGSETYNLSVGQYQLRAYAFDVAGNSVTTTVDFSIVPSVNLLIDPRLIKLDGAGNYHIHTALQSTPNLESVGLWRNGVYVDDLQWDLLAQNYSLDFQLTSPGVWGITLYARTTLGQYDMQHYTVVWNPPVPVVQSVDLTWKSSYYDVQVEIDTSGLPVSQVTLGMAGQTYPLYYQTVWNRYVAQIYVTPRNLTAELAIWYPWDDDAPSYERAYELSWFAPSIQIEAFQPARQNFTLTILAQKTNASLDSSLIYLVVHQGNTSLNVAGTLVFTGVAGAYQRWQFSSPVLTHSVWEYSVFAHDIYGTQGVIHGIFNGTDLPPIINQSSFIQVSYQDEGGNVQVAVQVFDDYGVTEVSLEVNGVAYPARFNGSHYLFDLWLSSGTYTPKIKVVDDIGQEAVQVIGPFQVATGTGNSSSAPSKPSSPGEPTAGAEANDATLEYLAIGASVVLSILGGNFMLNRRKEGRT